MKEVTDEEKTNVGKTQTEDEKDMEGRERKVSNKKEREIMGNNFFYERKDNIK